MNTLSRFEKKNFVCDSPDTLRNAIESNDIRAVRKLLGEKVELFRHLDTSDVKKYLLRRAAIFNDKKIVDLLFSVPDVFKSVGKDQLDDFLHNAVSNGNVRPAEFLLMNGAKITKATCVLRLFDVGNIDVCKNMLLLLLHYGFQDFRIRNEEGQNLLQILCENSGQRESDEVDIANILLNSEIPIDERDKDGYTPLHRVVYKEIISLVSFLINKGADVNTKNNFGDIPLLDAYDRINDTQPDGTLLPYREDKVEDQIKLVKLLLSNGAKVNSKTSNGWTALHKACHRHYPEMINLLIRRGADVTAETNQGETPLFFLETEYGKYDLCMLLMIKEFSKLTIKNPLVSDANMNLIQIKPRAQDYFETCTNELKQMASFKFYKNLTFLSMLNKSINIHRLARFTKIEEVEMKFDTIINKLVVYKIDLKNIWEKAIQCRGNFEILISRLYSAFGNLLPDTVIRKLAYSFSLKDIPLE